MAITPYSMTESEIRAAVEDAVGAYPWGNTIAVAFVPSADGPYCITCGVNILTNEISEGGDEQWEWSNTSDTFVLFTGPESAQRPTQTARLYRDTDPSPISGACFGCGESYGALG